MLLTRPFFLYLLSLDIQEYQLKRSVSFPQQYNAVQKLSVSCLIASIHTIDLTYEAHKAGYLPRVNLWPTYGQ